MPFSFKIHIFFPVCIAQLICYFLKNREHTLNCYVCVPYLNKYRLVCQKALKKISISSYSVSYVEYVADKVRVYYARKEHPHISIMTEQ